MTERPSELVGRVVSYQSGFYRVECDVPGFPYLRTHELLRSQMLCAQLGDVVKLRYWSGRTQAFWHVVEVLS